MSFVAVRSIPLSEQTREAWRSAGAIYPRRGRTQEEIESRWPDHTIINLGASWFDSDRANVWNNGPDVAPLLTPKASRDKLGFLMPTMRWVGPDKYWVKYPGRGGSGKTLVEVEDRNQYDELLSRVEWTDGDIQLHIVGQEYRVITVNDKVVQASERHGVNGNRRYQWVGVRNAPSAVKAIARDAANALSGDNIIGWDILLHDSGDAYLLEGNSCPGVNEATAARIIAEVNGVSYESA